MESLIIKSFLIFGFCALWYLNAQFDEVLYRLKQLEAQLDTLQGNRYED